MHYACLCTKFSSQELLRMVVDGYCCLYTWTERLDLQALRNSKVIKKALITFRAP